MEARQCRERRRVLLGSSSKATGSPVTIGTRCRCRATSRPTARRSSAATSCGPPTRTGRRAARPPGQAGRALRRLEPGAGRHQLPEADRLQQGRARLRPVLDAADRSLGAHRGPLRLRVRRGRRRRAVGVRQPGCTTSSTSRSRSSTTSSRSRSGSPRCRRPSGRRRPPTRPSTTRSPSPSCPSAQKILQAAGVKTVYSKVFPAEVTDYTPIAGQVARAKPDVVLLGSVDVPTVSAFVHAFIQQHYSPKAFIATAGPDQGAAFVKAVGTGNENGIFVPNGWYGGFQKADSEQMVKEYIAKYGGTPRTSTPTSPRPTRSARSLAAGGRGHPQLRPAEDHRLPAQRRDARQRPGPGEVRLARREHRAEDADLPVAERHPRAVDPDRRRRAQRRPSTRSPPGSALQTRSGLTPCRSPTCCRRSSTGS